MLERDVREHDDARLEHVRRVVAPAETRLDDGDVDPGLRKRREGRRRQNLELRRSDPLGRAADSGDGALEVGVLAADADALAPAAHVR